MIFRGISDPLTVEYDNSRQHLVDGLQVNGQQLHNVTHAEAISTLKSTSGRVHLVVGRAPMSPELNNNKSVGKQSRHDRINSKDSVVY